MKIEFIAGFGPIAAEPEKSRRFWTEQQGHRLLRRAAEEEWGQTVARLLSPEGLLVGISHTPWMHVTAEG